MPGAWMTRGMMGRRSTQAMPSAGKIVAARGAVPNCTGVVALATIVFVALNCGALLSKLTAVFHAMSGDAWLCCWATDEVAPCPVEVASSPMVPLLGGATGVMSRLPNVN